MAEAAGRPVIGTQDIIYALEQTRPSSTNWKELRDFAFVNVKEPDMRDDDGGTKWRMPFLHKVPPFPVHVRRSEAPVSENVTEKRPEIPDHFPPFPPVHTYKRSDTKSKKRNRSENSSHSASKKSVQSVQKSLSRIEDAAERAQIEHVSETLGRDGVRFKADVSTQGEIPRMIEKTAHKKEISVNLNSVPPETIQNLSKEQRMLLGLGSDSL